MNLRYILSVFIKIRVVFVNICFQNPRGRGCAYKGYESNKWVLNYFLIERGINCKMNGKGGIGHRFKTNI